MNKNKTMLIMDKKQVDDNDDDDSNNDNIKQMDVADFGWLPLQAQSTAINITTTTPHLQQQKKGQNQIEYTCNKRRKSIKRIDR